MFVGLSVCSDPPRIETTNSVSVNRMCFRNVMSYLSPGLRPRTPVEERLATICVLPLFLSGVLGAPDMNKEELALYLRELILQSSLKTGAITRTPELIDAVRFLWYALFGNKVNSIVVGLSG